MHWLKSTTYFRCISYPFPNNLIINNIIYPKTRFCFGRLGYTLLEFIIVIITILTDGIASYSVYSCSLFKKKDASTMHMLILCTFTH